uniref:Uncharacterized protein n=1 Tax=Steinernema glaseri TaxID=37863 RepID=A0A1I7YCN4_9BILA
MLAQGLLAVCDYRYVTIGGLWLRRGHFYLSNLVSPTSASVVKHSGIPRDVDENHFGIGPATNCWDYCVALLLLLPLLLGYSSVTRFLSCDPDLSVSAP